MAALLPPLTMLELLRNSQVLENASHPRPGHSLPGEPKPTALGHQFPKGHLFSRNWTTSSLLERQRLLSNEQCHHHWFTHHPPAQARLSPGNKKGMALAHV